MGKHEFGKWQARVMPVTRLPFSEYSQEKARIRQVESQVHITSLPAICVLPPPREWPILRDVTNQ
jgi:hypothetical protein